MTCRFLAERSGNGKGVRWWGFCPEVEGAAMAKAVRECASFYAAAFALCFYPRLFDPCLCRRFWMVIPPVSCRAWVGCGVVCVCACTGMVEWVGGRERYRGERLFIDAAKLVKSS